MGRGKRACESACSLLPPHACVRACPPALRVSRRPRGEMGQGTADLRSHFACRPPSSLPPPPQVHKKGADITYFTRSGKENAWHFFDPVIFEQVCEKGVE